MAVRWAKVLGVAGVVAAIGATGVVVYRRRRRRVVELPPDELRDRLHERLAAASV
jgi:hypothetical protein